MVGEISTLTADKAVEIGTNWVSGGPDEWSVPGGMG